MATALGLIKVTKQEKTIQVSLDNNTDSLDTAELYLRRVGEYVDFVVYSPAVITATSLKFIFDSLLLDKNYGRYLATLKIGGVDKLAFYLQYVNTLAYDVAAIN